MGLMVVYGFYNLDLRNDRMWYNLPTGDLHPSDCLYIPADSWNPKVERTGFALVLLGGSGLAEAVLQDFKECRKLLVDG